MNQRNRVRIPNVTLPAEKFMKVIVTSTCPYCKQEYRREEYLGIPIGILGLTVCDKCMPDKERFIMCGNEKVWHVNVQET